MGAHFQAAGQALTTGAKGPREHLQLSDDLTAKFGDTAGVWKTVVESLKGDLLPSQTTATTPQQDLEKFMADSRPLNQAAERTKLQARLKRSQGALLNYLPEDAGYKTTQAEIASDEAALAKLAKTAPSAATEIKGLQEAQASYKRHIEVRKDQAAQAAERAKERRTKRWEYIAKLQSEADLITAELTTLEAQHATAHADKQRALTAHEDAVNALFAERITSLNEPQLPADATGATGTDSQTPAPNTPRPSRPDPVEAAAQDAAATQDRLRHLESLVQQLQAERASTVQAEAEFHKTNFDAKEAELPTLTRVAPEELQAYAKIWDILSLWHSHGANSPFTYADLVQLGGLGEDAGKQLELLLGDLTQHWWQELTATTVIPRQAAIFAMRALDKLQGQLAAVERDQEQASVAVKAIHAGAKRRRGA